MSIKKRTTEDERRHRTKGAMSILSLVAQFQEIGCDVSVSIKGETRFYAERDGIRYDMREHGRHGKDTVFPIAINSRGVEWGLQRPSNARDNPEDALHDLYECVVHDPRQDGIELKGIAYTDTR